jgi:hypothetical protein
MGAQGAEVKAAQLAPDTVEPNKDSRITSDFGAKQSNTDDWLRVNREDQIGPMLLEDSFAREKVGGWFNAHPLLLDLPSRARFTVLTMSVSLSVSSTPAAPVPLVHSSYTRRSRNSHTLPFSTTLLARPPSSCVSLLY